MEEAGGFAAQEAEEDDDHTQGRKMVAVLRKLRRMMITLNLPQQAEEDDDHTQGRKMVAVFRKLRRMMIILNLGGSWWLCCSGS